MIGGALLPLIFPACKFLQSVVHMVQAFFDPLPVTCQHTLSPWTDHSTHSGEHKQHQCEYEACLDESHHMISVPCVLPNMSAIAIALKNMPVMIHTMSISTSPCSRSSRPSVSDTEVPVLSVSPAVCSWPSRSSQHPYCHGYCYDIVSDDHDLYYHT